VAVDWRASRGSQQAEPRAEPHKPQGAAPVDVERAALQLGVKPDAVRKRLRRGTLAGRRVGNGWDVWLDGASREPSRDEPPGKPPGEPDKPPEQATQAVVLAEENAWLRRRVEALELALNREQEAVLRLSAALGLRPALDAPARAERHESTPAPVDAVQQPSRRWWRFWRA
jgi:hypothetical protein